MELWAYIFVGLVGTAASTDADIEPGEGHVVVLLPLGNASAVDLEGNSSNRSHESDGREQGGEGTHVD